MKSQTREQWLEKAVVLLTPLFKKQGYKVPKMRVSCGWPSSRGISKKPLGSIAIGECWAAQASTDKKPQIFISPRIAKADGQYGVLPVLAHEMGHGIVGNKHGHDEVFGKCVRSVHLEGKLTHTVGGEEFFKTVRPILKKLGKYPHAELKPGYRPVKKQTTRLVKCECKDCGYNCRVTRKWLEEVGAPLCPCNEKAMEFEVSL